MDAQPAAGTHDGKWSAKWMNDRGQNREATVEIANESGTWKLLNLPQAGGTLDPCDTRVHPLAVKQVAPDQLDVEIQRSKGLAGCRDGTFKVRRAADGSLEGAYGNGMKLTLVRK